MTAVEYLYVTQYNTEMHNTILTKYYLIISSTFNGIPEGHWIAIIKAIIDFYNVVYILSSLILTWRL